jgi:hypothetical protein
VTGDVNGGGVATLVNIDDYTIEELLEDAYIDPDLQLPAEPMNEGGAFCVCMCVCVYICVCVCE